MSKTNSPVRRIIKVVSWTVSILALLFVLLVLAIRTPRVQTRLTGLASSWLESKTGAQLNIDQLYLTFRGDLQMDRLFLATTAGDTLLYSEYLEVGASLPALVEGDISLTRINWQGVVAEIRADESGVFNFQFIIDAFSTGETSTPTPSTESISLELGPIALQNIRVRYFDDQNKIDVNASIKQLSLVPEALDLDSLIFHVDAGSIDGADVEVMQFGTSETTNVPDTVTSLLPEITIDALAIQHVAVRYISRPDSLLLETRVGNVNLEAASLHLNDNAIKGQLLSIDDTDMALSITSNSTQTTASTDPIAFVWPDWYVDLARLEINNSQLGFDFGSAADDPLFVDPNQMNWHVQSIDVADIRFAPYEVQLNLKELNLTEVNQDLQIIGQLEAQLDQDSIDINNLQLAVSDSKLSADFKANYSSFDSLLIDPLSAKFLAKIQELHLSPTELRQLAPLLKDQPALRFLLDESITSSGVLDYSREHITVSALTANWSEQTRLFIDGQVDHPLDSSLFKLALSQIELSSKGRNLAAIKSAFDLPVDLPNRIALEGNVTASSSSLDGLLRFDSNEGDFDIAATLTDWRATPVFNAKTNFENIDLGKWLETEQLGKVDGGLDIVGKGLTLEDITADAHLMIKRIDLLDQQLDSIRLDMALDSGDYELELKISEPNITAELSGRGKFVSAEEFTTDLQLALGQFDLEGWDLTEDSILVSSNIDLQLERSADRNTLALKVADSKFLSSSDEHLLRPITADLTSTTDSLFYRLSSGLFSGSGQVNASINDLIERSADLTVDSTQLAIDELLDGLVASAHFKIHPTSDEFERIWPQIDVVDTARLHLTINQPASDYQLYALVPDVAYKNQQLHQLEATLFNQADTLHYQIGFEEFKSGPAQISDLTLNGRYVDQELYNALLIEGSTAHPIIKVETTSRWSSDTIYTHIVPESLILDSLAWSLPPTNQLVYHNGHLDFEDFVLTHDNDLLEISSPNIEQGSELDLRFENFQIGTFTSILNASDYPATGEINGFVDINESSSEYSILADLGIKDLRVLDQDLGILTWRSKSDLANGSLIDLSITSPDVDVSVAGALALDGALDLQVALDKIAMSMVEGFSEGAINQTTGYIAGSMSITGYDSLPNYSGSVDFHGASFVVTDINAPFTLEDESITIDNETISFDSFTVRDELNNVLELNGNVKTDDFADPAFDFHIVGKNFQLLNSTAKDNELYYGKVDIDIDLAVKGRQSAPTVDVSARLNAGSTFTYVLPESQLEIEERDGVIMFFNQNDSSTLDEAVIKRPKIIDIEGVLLKSKLVIDPQTKFTMIIDKRSGDFLEIGGEANLNLNIDRKGNTTLTGIYTARHGAYEVRLYEIVQRRFEVVPGSRIIWAGDPYMAELDLTAQYNLRTSVRELMEQQVTSADPTTKVASQQDLPFEVLLNIQGSLEQPLMSFRLDMPEGSRNELGGNIYARINQINENEDELNKQVFSLVAFNQFLPSAVTNASGTSTSNIAKSSVNQILSSQLNNLSQRYIKGIDVDFNLNSIADYQTGSAQERTELSVSIRKALFDDRVIISVGNSVDIDGQSRQSNEWVDDVSIEYKLTDDGRYRLKGFQKNSFEDLVEGQVTITGLALLFSKEFNQFRNIFNKTVETK
ncbi:MAG: translocation/assembly module TamB domain-containing protein [Cyclobacteriaceae bacterium]